MAGKKGDASPQDRFTIQVVSRRTGLTPEVLRVWEKRYRVVRPERTPTGRRVYSAEEVERLRLLRQATLAGRRIGDIAELSNAELTSLTQEDLRAEHQRPSSDRPSDNQATAVLDEAFARVSATDSEGLQHQLSRALVLLTGLEFVEDFLSPLFERIGESWERGELDPHQEHMATAVVRGTLHPLFLAASSGSAPTLVAATPRGHAHEVGALLAAVTAGFAGYRVVYLGPDLPADSIDQAVRLTGASAVGLSVVYPSGDAGIQRELKTLRKLLPEEVPLILGGRAAADYARGLKGVHCLSGYRQLEAALRHLASGGSVINGSP